MERELEDKRIEEFINSFSDTSDYNSGYVERYGDLDEDPSRQLDLQYITIDNRLESDENGLIFIEDNEKDIFKQKIIDELGYVNPQWELESDDTYPDGTSSYKLVIYEIGDE